MDSPLLLLKTLLLSTSQSNIYRHSKDKKKRGKIVGGYIGNAVLYLMLMTYCIVMCIGYGAIGIIGEVPVLCALTISALALLLTFFKTNGYLFNFREYDMLMSLPFEEKTVAGCKFMYMYIKSLPWNLSISLAMLIGYGIYAKPAGWIYPLWLVLSLFVPLIPMLAAAFLGFLIARVSAGFRKTNTIQTIITMAFVIFCFFLRFILQDMFQNGKVEETMEHAAAMTGNAAGVYLPARWFAEAVTEGSMSSALLLAGASLLLFGALFAVVGKSYGRINSAMKSHAASGKYKMTGQKQRSVLNAIAFKEFRRMTGSTIYVTNAGLGFVLAPIMGILTLIIGADRIVSMMTANASFDYSIIQPAIPFIVYFFIGMVASTACSPALEGKNYWIVQSLPITRRTLYQGKMLFNMYLAVPAMAFSTLCICISAKVPAVNTMLYLLLGFALCAFSTAWGCVCGVSHMRLDWENEVEVIKQGTAVLLYMLPNMFIVMGLVVGVVFLGLKIDHRLIAAGFTLIVGFLALLSYLKVMSLARKEDGLQ